MKTKIRVIIFSILILYLIYLKWIISFLLPQSIFFEPSPLKVILCIMFLILFMILMQYYYISNKIYIKSVEHNTAYYREWGSDYYDQPDRKLKLTKLHLDNIPGTGYREQYLKDILKCWKPSYPYNYHVKEYLNKVNSAKKRFPQSKIMLKLIKGFVQLKNFQVILIIINKKLKRIEMYFLRYFIFLEKIIRTKFLNRLELNLWYKYLTFDDIAWIPYLYKISPFSLLKMQHNDGLMFFYLFPMSLIILSLILDIFILQELYYIYLCAPLYLIVKFYEYYVFLYKRLSYKWLKELKEGIEVRIITFRGSLKWRVKRIDFLQFRYKLIAWQGDFNNIPAKSVICFFFTGKSITNYNTLLDASGEKFFVNTFFYRRHYKCGQIHEIYDYYREIYEHMAYNLEYSIKIISCKFNLILLIILSLTCILILLKSI
jgi:hypothetical protein